MSDDFDGCPECSEDEGEIEISQSRLEHISVSLDLGKAITFQNPINPTISAGKMWDPSEYKEACVNPACGEWQDDIETILERVNNGLEDVVRTGDWSHIEKEDIEYLSQLSKDTLDRVDEQGIEWPDIGKKVRWKEIEHKIDDFEENFEPAAEYAVSLHNLRGTPNPGIDKLPETASSLENLTELKNRIETEVAADVETAPNESDEEEEKGPIEGLEAEIGELKEEKEERIEERKAERETRIGELKAEVEKLKEEQQENVETLKEEKEDRIEERKAEIDELKEERDDRIGWREEEIEELSEENEEQIGELQEQIWEIRKQKEDQIDTRREQITESRDEYEEKITETRETYNEQIEETRAENNERITEIRDEYDEQITGIRGEYENRIDERRDQLTELREQDEDKIIEASAERDRDEGKEAAGGGRPAGGVTVSTSPGAATPEQERESTSPSQSRSEPTGEPTETATGAVANGGAGNGAPSSTGKSEQDGESKQTTDVSTSGFDPNRTLSDEEIRELELNSDWSQYNQPRNGSYPTDDPDQTNESDGPTREESTAEKDPEKGDGERGGIV